MLTPETAEDLTAALRGLIRRTRTLNVRAREADPDVMPTWLAALLANLEHGEGSRLGDLAERLGVTASTLSRQVTYAESLGYARRAADPGDRRAACLTLTEDGAEALRSYRARFVRLLQEAVPDWTDEEGRDLVDRINRLGAAVDRFRDTRP
ncbi:MarR family winged helix-turn-helix transcriptional regulator [Rhodococcus zopfii]|uniref:MarR family transcriptional regulator n=1 Tax=Rhodococcus zopfii TaxID=43772 RepID=A0ABU3WNQ7_9NOCA|nr:MarR family transcriptional regulator [Rhodococcus zopfii]MDV2475610.1 MarR family transcriptional regulator [Rhodococcus zopfii]